MSPDNKEFWAAIPEKALHPLRIPILEAFQWIAEPLSAIDLVDVLEGEITMWDAGHHLCVLDELNLTKRHPSGRDRPKKRDVFGLCYRLTVLDGQG